MIRPHRAPPPHTHPYCRHCHPNHRHRHHLQAQDDWVPLEVVRDLVRSMFASSVRLLQDICPADELNWAEL